MEDGLLTWNALSPACGVLFGGDVRVHAGPSAPPEAGGAGGRGGMKNLRLKSARAAKDLSQQQLADLVSVSRQTINAIEKGDYNPTIRLCISICRALGKHWTNYSGRRKKQ